MMVSCKGRKLGPTSRQIREGGKQGPMPKKGREAAGLALRQGKKEENRDPHQTKMKKKIINNKSR